jgi:hypothetical protein
MKTAPNPSSVTLLKLLISIVWLMTFPDPTTESVVSDPQARDGRKNSVIRNKGTNVRFMGFSFAFMH